MEIYHVFSSRVEFFLGICHILNLMTAIVLKVNCTAEYMFFWFFLWVRPPPFKHPIWLWPFPKGYKNMKTAYFPALATNPSLWKNDIKWSITWITWGPLFHEYLVLVALMGRDSTVGSGSQVMRFNLWMNAHLAWWCEACQCHLDENWTPRSEIRLST